MPQWPIASGPPLRLLGSLFALSLVAAACSGPDEDVSAGRQETTEADPTSTSGASSTTDTSTGPASTSTGSTTGTTPTTTTATTTSTTTAAGSLPTLDLALTPVGQFSQPVALRDRPGTSQHYVAENSGRIRRLADRSVALDISGSISTGSEQGLLGLAFSSDGQTLYVSYTDTTGASRVDEFAMAGSMADPASRREILRVAQPFSNHNGGDIHIGPDGLLWIGLGDGGSGGDPGGHGQNTSTLLGSILRIDPSTRDAGAYGIPAGNPFAAGGGAPEIWAYGLRNPWRFSFDRDTGDLWIGDVGQDAWEEVSVLRGPGRQPGANLGWNLREGSHRFAGDRPAGAVDPIIEYPHRGGVCSVTGGYVYRGRAIPGLAGAYVYADFCVGGLRVHRDGEDHTFDLATGNVSGFGEDASGELYVLSLGGSVYRLDPG